MNHFAGKEAIEHVHQKKAEGRAEIHGVEMAGSINATLDAIRETGMTLLLFWALLSLFYTPTFKSLLLFGLGCAIWKGGRAAILSWARLERLHRIVKQEKHEIEHHRMQEREELEVLYKEKGFSGPLLTEVVDFLMADQDRLLKVMLEEELGLTLEAYEHPLKQGLFAFLGAFTTAICLPLLFILSPQWGIGAGALFFICASAAISAALDKNRIISSVVWHLAFIALTLGIIFFIP